MKNSIKRIFALVLALVMVVTLIPANTTAQAASLKFAKSAASVKEGEKVTFKVSGIKKGYIIKTSATNGATVTAGKERVVATTTYQKVGVTAASANFVTTMKVYNASKKLVKTYSFKAITVTKPATGLTAAKQYSSTAVIATIADGKDSSSYKTTDFTITNVSTNMVFPVKSVEIDSKDATQVTLNVYSDMKDGAQYTVKYADKTATFTATTGVVTQVALNRTEVPYATETEMVAYGKDANGVIVDEIKSIGNSVGTSGKYDFNITTTQGYLNSNKLYLNALGNTATVKIVYHSQKYNSTGVEEGNIESGSITVTATAQATAGTYEMKVATAGKYSTDGITGSTTSDGIKADAKVWSNVKAVSNVTIGDNLSVYVINKKSDNSYDKMSTGYVLESSDKNVLVIQDNATYDVNGVAVVPVKAGTAYVLVKKQNTDGSYTTVATFPVTVSANRNLGSISLDKTSFTVSNALSANNTVKVTAYDQYGQKYTNYTLTVEPVNTTSKLAIEPVPGTDKVTFNAYQTNKAGTYTYKITATDVNKTSIKQVRTFSVTVQAPTGTVSGIDIDISRTTADLCVSNDYTADDDTIEITVYDTLGGVRNNLEANATINVKRSDGEPITWTNVNGAKATWQLRTVTNNYTVLSANGAVSQDTVLNNGDYIVKNYKTGAYVITVTVGNKTYTKTVVLTDSQPAVTVERKDSAWKYYINGESKDVTPTAENRQGNTAYVNKQSFFVPFTYGDDNSKVINVLYSDVAVNQYAN